MKGHIRFHKGSWNAVLFQGRRVNSKGKLADCYQWIGGFQTQKEAHEELTRQLNSKIEGSYIEPHKMTLAAYLEHWLSVKKTSLAPTTHQRYGDICKNNIIPALGAFRLVKLTAVDIERFYADMLRKGRKSGQKGLSPTTVVQFHRILHKALKDARKKKLVMQNVADAAEAPRKAEYDLQPPDHDIMAVLLAQVHQDCRIWLPTVIACGTGLRRGEILALRWRDINIVTGEARILRSLSQTRSEIRFKDLKKGKKGHRTLTLPDFVLEALREARSEQLAHRKMFGPDYHDHDLVCCLPDGNFILPSLVTKLFCRHRRSLGLSTRFHDLRHGHASQALQNGVPVKTVQERLGHSTAAFTLDVYGHLLPGDDRRAAETIQRNLGPALEREMKKPIN